MSQPAAVPYKRIATEEAFCPPDLLKRYRKLIDDQAVDDIGFNSMWGFYTSADSPRCVFIRDHLVDMMTRGCDTWMRQASTSRCSPSPPRRCR
jgi:2,3-dihydroxybenzoate decarboxylase